MNKNNSLLILLMLSFSFLCFSQKCEVKNDPFNGKKKVTYGEKQKAIYVELSEGLVLWDFDILYKGEYNTVLEKGTEISLKLENGQTVTLTVDKKIQPISRILGEQVYTSYIPTLLIDKENLDKLSSSSVMLFRYPDMNGGYIDLDTKGSRKVYWKKFFKAMQCMKANYN